MPYVAAPVRVLGDVIAKTMPYARLPLEAPARTRIFLVLQVKCFCGDLSCCIKTPMCIFYKEVYEQKWYQKGLLIALEESHEKYL
jgi:hypothetical protein